MRHSSLIINQIKELRTNNFTLTEIVKKTGISKSTIFGYIQYVPRSKNLEEKIRLAKLEGLKHLLSRDEERA